MKEKLKIFLNGLFFENPTLVIFLGMCPALGTTDTVEHALYMSACVLAVLISSNIIISLIRNIVPNEVRIPVYIIIIATLVTVVDMLFHAFLSYNVYQSIGMFISLIVVNCFILGRAESFASKHNVVESIFDAIGYACGFAMAVLFLSFFRELLGTGHFTWAGHVSKQIIPEKYVIKLFAQNYGAFIGLGLEVALFTAIMNPIKEYREKKAKEKAAQAAATGEVK